MDIRAFEALREDCAVCGGVGFLQITRWDYEARGTRLEDFDCTFCRGTGNRGGLLPKHSASGKIARELRAA